MRITHEKGRHDRSCRPFVHRREFPPAIPRRVAPQQSPLPLRRINPYTSSNIAAAIPRPQNLSPISLSHTKGAVQVAVAPTLARTHGFPIR